MPLDGRRMARLRKLKGNLKQADLARAVGATQTHVSDCEGGKEPSVQLLEKIADAMDCTTDFLLHRSFVGVDDDEELFRAAVSRMAFDVFASDKLTDEQRDRCRKVIRHRAAPLTADDWRILSEQIDLAIGQTNGGSALHVVHGA